jgi:hypothetical protein
VGNLASRVVPFPLRAVNCNPSFVFPIRMLAALQDDDGSLMGAVNRPTVETNAEGGHPDMISKGLFSPGPGFIELNMQTTVKSSSSGSMTSASASPASKSDPIQSLPEWSARREVFESKGSNLSIVYGDSTKSNDFDRS